MSQRLQADPVEALDARESLRGWLEALRGAPLRPLRVEDRLHGLGALAAWHADSGVGTECGVDALPDEPRRCVAALFREWGLACVGRGEHQLAAGYLTLALRILLGHPDAPGALRRFLLDEQADSALSALETGDTEAALLHWGQLAAHDPSGSPRRQALVQRALHRESGVALAGMERGVVGGELAALGRLRQICELEPDSDDVHLTILRLAAHAGLRYHTLGDRGSFADVTTAAAPSLLWATDQSPGSLSTVENEHVAEASVCAAAATELPWEAVAHLRRAVLHGPNHPTARKLLAVALAALAARRLGHGRDDEARAAATEAAALFRELDMAPPDPPGWALLCERMEVADEPV
jgi:hypothetical protein